MHVVKGGYWTANGELFWLEGCSMSWRVPLDKSEGSVKGKLILGGADSTACFAREG